MLFQDPAAVVSNLDRHQPLKSNQFTSIRLLALDIDGTLVNSRDELTAPTTAAVKRAAEAGLRIVLATGRRYSRALPLVEPLAIDAPLITASGALIKRPATHETLHRAEFPRDVLCETLAEVSAAGYEAVVYADTFHQGFDFYCPRLDAPQMELADYLSLNLRCGVEYPHLMRNPPPGVFAGFACGTREEMLNLADRLERRLPGQLYVHVLRSPRYIGHMCEISVAGNTKWSGIQRLAHTWGIADDEICAVGDDVNDLPMIAGAGFGIAMGNALPEVQAAADAIAPSHDEDGLVRVVEWLLS